MRVIRMGDIENDGTKKRSPSPLCPHLPRIEFQIGNARITVYFEEKKQRRMVEDAMREESMRKTIRMQLIMGGSLADR